MCANSGVKRVDLQINSGGMAKFPKTEISIVHGFSTMLLENMSKKYGNPNQAMRNQKRALSLLQFSTEMMVKMVPWHTDKIEVVNRSHRGEGVECDALITSRRQVGLMLLPADCYPVIITGDDNERYSSMALVHSGRKGTRLGIVAKTIQKMKEFGVNPSSARVAIGPGIGPCCYNGTDLVPEIVEQVIEEGVPEKNIVVANCCTCCSRDSQGEYLFFSHARAQREQGEQNGRFMAFSVLG